MDDCHSNKGFIERIKNFINPCKQQTNNTDSLRNAIEELIEEEKNPPSSDVAQHERLLISNILTLRDIPVVDIMIPRADIISININSSKEDLLSLLVEKPHSRIPVYDGGLDNITGVLYTKDIIATLSKGGEFKINDIMSQNPLMISPAMRVMDLLLQFKKSKVHIAFVVDEFGGIDGLVTISDLVEAIVGEINEEHDDFDIEPQFIERPDGTVIADARYAIEDLEEKYGNIFSEDDENEDVDTLAGLVINIAGHMPTRGEIIHHSSGIEFEIIEADPRKIIRLRIRHLPKKKQGLRKK